MVKKPKHSKSEGSRSVGEGLDGISNTGKSDASKEGFPILPTSKVAALLDYYPELEDVLIGIAPPFKKLKNPFLRKSIAKVASLRHIAVVGGVSLDVLINTLRRAVGQEAISLSGKEVSIHYFTEQPDWFIPENIVTTLNEADTDPNKMALIALNEQANKLTGSEILELQTSFLPAPGIDIMRQKGFLSWTVKINNNEIKTYFTKKTN